MPRREFDDIIDEAATLSAEAAAGVAPIAPGAVVATGFPEEHREFDDIVAEAKTPDLKAIEKRSMWGHMWSELPNRLGILFEPLVPTENVETGLFAAEKLGAQVGGKDWAPPLKDSLRQGATRGSAEALAGFTSPAAIATGGLLATGGPLARIAGAGMAAIIGEQFASEDLPAVAEAIAAQDPEATGEAAVRALVSGGLTAAVVPGMARYVAPRAPGVGGAAAGPPPPPPRGARGRPPTPGPAPPPLALPPAGAAGARATRMAAAAGRAAPVEETFAPGAVRRPQGAPTPVLDPEVLYEPPPAPMQPPLEVDPAVAAMYVAAGLPPPTLAQAARPVRAPIITAPPAPEAAPAPRPAPAPAPVEEPPPELAEALYEPQPTQAEKIAEMARENVRKARAEQLVEENRRLREEYEQAQALRPPRPVAEYEPPPERGVRITETEITPTRGGLVGKKVGEELHPVAPKPPPGRLIIKSLETGRTEVIPETSPETLADKKSRVVRLAERFDEVLRDSHLEDTPNFPGNPMGLRKLAQEAVGGTATEYTEDMEDAVEVAFNNELWRRLGQNPEAPLTRQLEIANQLEYQIPRAHRTLDKIDLQQFSTPLPIAVAAQEAAQVRPGERLLEPTAGTGNLINLQTKTGLTGAIELSPRRAELLRSQGYSVTEGDYLKTPAKADVIITNPPWGKFSTGKYGGAIGLEFTPGDVAERFVAKNMRDLAPGGRVVAVMPTTMLGPHGAPFRQWLNKEHTVRALINSPPSAYTTRATNVESVLLVVDKGKVPGAPAPLRLEPKTWEEYARAVERLREAPYARTRGAQEPAPGKRPEPTVAAPAPGAPSPTPVAEPAQARPAEAEGPARGSARGGEAPGPGRPVRGEGRPPEPGRDVGVGGGRPAPVVEAPPRVAGPVAERPAPGALRGTDRPTAPRPAGKAERGEGRARSSEFFAPYPRRAEYGGPPHPKLIVEARQLAGAPYPPLTIKPHPKTLEVLKAGRVSAEQFEQAMAAVQSNLEQHRGYLTADNVGVGKSREIAVLLLDLMHRAIDAGKPLRLVVGTKGRNNLADLIDNELYYVATGRTLEGVDLANPDAEREQPGRLPFEIVRTIDLKDAKKEGADYRPPPTYDHAIYLMDFPNLAKFGQALLDVEPHGIIGDEAHKFKNIGGAKAGGTWQKLHAQIIQRVKREDQVFAYYTATPAQTVSDYQYLYGLRVWPIDGFNAWIQVITGHADVKTAEDVKHATEAGAIDFGSITGSDVVGSDGSDVEATRTGTKFGKGAAEDVFASMLTPAEAEQIPREWKIQGIFSARDLWREGTEFQIHEAKLPEAAIERYDRFVEIARRIITASKKWAKFNKKPSRFGVRGMLQFAAKRVQMEPALDEAIRLAQEYLEQGYQPVLSLINVGETDPESGYFAAAISQINDRAVESDEVEGFVDLGEIPEALIEKAELLDLVKDFGPLPSPIKRIEDAFGAKNVAFIIGGRGKNLIAEMRDFQQGKRTVAVISAAGATGISIDHRVKTPKGAGGRRVFIDTQYEWSATESLQRYGRVDRASSISPPRILAVTFGTAAEKKFLATIANRMASLGALSKGGAETTGAGALEEFELEGDDALIAMREAYQDLPGESKKQFMGSQFVDGWDGRPKFATSAFLKDFALELQFMPIGEANLIWEAFTEKLEVVKARRAAVVEKRTARTKGEILRTTELKKNLTLYEVKSDAGNKFGIIAGLVTEEMPKLRHFLADPTTGSVVRRYVSFTAGDDTVAGLEILPTRIRGLAGTYGKLAGKEGFKTPEDVLEALRAGDRVPLQQGVTEGPTQGQPWKLRMRQDGKIAIEGPKMVDREMLQRWGAAYQPVGNFWYVTTETLPKFIDRFKPKGPEVEPPTGIHNTEDFDPEAGFATVDFLANLATGFAPVLYPVVAKQTKIALGTRNEQYVGHLGPIKGNRAYQLELLKGIYMEAGEADIATLVAKRLSNDDYFQWLARIPYIGQRGAAKILRLARALPYVGKKFGVARGEMEALFDAAEGIKGLTRTGEPIFGTRIFERNPDGSFKVDDAGLPLWDWRVKPDDAESLFDALSSKGKEAVLWWVHEREVLKKVFEVVGGIEGYMHHFWEDGFFDRMQKVRFRYKRAPERRARKEAEGYVRNFEASVEKSSTDLFNERIYNNFLREFKDTVTEPIDKDVGVHPGWIEIDRLRPTKAAHYVGQLAGGRQIPQGLAEEFLQIIEGAVPMSLAAEAVVNLGRYWKANVLALNPTSTVTNLVSGALQYTTKTVHDLWRGTFTGNFRPFLFDLFGVIDALRPSTIENLPPEYFGAGANIRTQFGPANTIFRKLIAIQLWQYSAVENYWKRALASSALRASGKLPDRAALIRDEQALIGLNHVVDQFAFNYANEPRWLTKFKHHPLGAVILPFPTYGYKLSRLYSYYLAAFNPFADLRSVRGGAGGPPRKPPKEGAGAGTFEGGGMSNEEIHDRLARMLTLATILGMVYGFWPEEDEKTGRFVPGMPWHLDKTGRKKVGVTRLGKEIYLRTVKYPWLNFVQATNIGRDMLRGERSAEDLAFLADEFWSEGPLTASVLILMGKTSRWDENKPMPVRWGELAKTWVPFFRNAEGIRSSGGEIPGLREGRAVAKIYPQTFPETLANAIPLPDSLVKKIPGMENMAGVRLAYKKELRTVWDNRQGKMVERQVPVPVILDPKIEALKFWAGVNMKEIDPSQFGKFKRRALANAIAAIHKADTPGDVTAAFDRLGQVDPVLARRFRERVKEREIRLTDQQKAYIDRVVQAFERQLKENR